MLFKEIMIKIVRSFIQVSLLGLMLGAVVFSQRSEESLVISGEVLDGLGNFVGGAVVTIIDSRGKEKSTVTNNYGKFRVNGLIPGKYAVRIDAPGFAIYENSSVDVKINGNKFLKVVLEVAKISEEVDVSAEGQLSTDADSNASALVLKEEDLEALPDDPDDLEEALQVLVGGGAGPNGGQIYIDGFEGGSIPSKEAIREIRVNRDPFSAEFDRLGFGRIEILTKPGFSTWRGRVYFNLRDRKLGARNPFAENKADTQRRFYGGYVSGPVIKNKASFSLEINNRNDPRGGNINATTIDRNFNIVPFQLEFKELRDLFFVSPRFDLQLNEKNTLTAAYDFRKITSQNFGGGFALKSRATQTENTSNTIKLTETAILNSKTINETRFQYRYTNVENKGDNTNPAINVAGAFLGGGAVIGLNFERDKFWEFQNYTTTSFGGNAEHGVKFGIRVRGRVLENRSESNYNGTFIFTGFMLNAPSSYDLDGNGIISSIEQYRAKLLGENDPRFNPSQFSIVTGNPFADVSQYDVGLFIKDDWRVSPKLSLSYGLRYENQTNIEDRLNFAPRISFAFSPEAGEAKTPKTVFRGAAGVFYTRFSEKLTLQAQRLDGIRQKRFIISASNPLLSLPMFTLNGVTNIPDASQFVNTATPLTGTSRIVEANMQSSYTIRAAFSFERQLPLDMTASAFYIVSRNFHLIRLRNVNAPVCPTGFACPIDDSSQLQLLRPDPVRGDIYQYESSGTGTSQQLILSLRSRIGSNFTFFSNYSLTKFESNAEGFPAYSYDLTGETAEDNNSRRHRFFFIGSLKAPRGISFRTFLIFISGSPFNITAGQDLNGDSIFNDRPTFGQLTAACARNEIVGSWCDIGGNDPNSTIPRNFGRGPKSFSVNLSLDKVFGFGKNLSKDSSGLSHSRDGRKRRRIGNVFRAGRKGRRGFVNERKRYNLTIGARVYNVFNLRNVNNPVGNINSPPFGKSTSVVPSTFRGAPRQIEFRVRFRW